MKKFYWYAIENLPGGFTPGGVFFAATVLVDFNIKSVTMVGRIAGIGLPYVTVSGIIDIQVQNRNRNELLPITDLAPNVGQEGANQFYPFAESYPKHSSEMELIAGTTFFCNYAISYLTTAACNLEMFLCIEWEQKGETKEVREWEHVVKPIKQRAKGFGSLE